MQWKDRSADGPVSANKPKKVKDRQRAEMKARGEKDEKSAGRTEYDEHRGEDSDASSPA